MMGIATDVWGWIETRGDAEFAAAEACDALPLQPRKAVCNHLSWLQRAGRILVTSTNPYRYRLLQPGSQPALEAWERIARLPREEEIDQDEPPARRLQVRPSGTLVTRLPL